MMGHVRDCLTHYLRAIHEKNPPGTSRAVKARGPMAEFCNVSVNTINRWIVCEEICPSGETLIKTMCFLDLLGYKVIELEGLSKLFRNFLELIGFGVFSTKLAAELLEYAPKRGETSVYGFLIRRDHGHDPTVSDHKRQRMLEIWMEKKQELGEKKRQADERYYIGFAGELPLLATPTILSMPSGQPEGSGSSPRTPVLHDVPIVQV